VRLTVCDTPGFGDNIDNELAFSTISDYLEKQCHDILGEESRIKRNARLEDNRVHALLYFIAPTGHRCDSSLFHAVYDPNTDQLENYSLREIDIELMRRLSPLVNVIPVIGKADSLTLSELKGFKERVGHTPILFFFSSPFIAISLVC
jgi:cell division control protein 11